MWGKKSGQWKNTEVQAHRSDETCSSCCSFPRQVIEENDRWVKCFLLERDGNLSTRAGNSLLSPSIHKTAAFQGMGEKLDFLGLWFMGVGNLIKLIGDTVFHKLRFINKWMSYFWKIRRHCRRQGHLSHPFEVERRLWFPRKFSFHSDGGAVL